MGSRSDKRSLSSLKPRRFEEVVGLAHAFDHIYALRELDLVKRRRKKINDFPSSPLLYIAQSREMSERKRDDSLTLETAHSLSKCSVMNQWDTSSENGSHKNERARLRRPTQNFLFDARGGC